MLKFIGQAARSIASRGTIPVTKTGLLVSAMTTGVAVGLSEATNKKNPALSQLSQDFKQRNQAQRAIPHGDAYLEVYVTATGPENGPGHASASFIVENDKGHEEVVGHTSYMPIAATTIFNAMTFGTLPVPAENFDPEEVRKKDLEKAEHIYRIPLSQEGLERGLEAQNKIAEGVDRGDFYYSVTGAFNGITVCCASLMHAYEMSQRITKDTHVEEDPSGLPVYGSVETIETISTAMDEASQMGSKVYNCTSAVTEVLGAATGKEIDYVVLPIDVVEQIKEHVPDANTVPLSKYQTPKENTEASTFDNNPPEP